jgi:transcriptional regulator with XRE-family HTH domain
VFPLRNAQHGSIAVRPISVHALGVVIADPNYRDTRALGPALRERRLAQGLSLRSATAGITGISATTLCRVETGLRQLRYGPALLALAERLGLPHDEVIDLAGGITPAGLGDLLGADIRLSLRGGRLTQTGREALRAVHIRELAARTAGKPLLAVADECNLDFRPVDEVPGFDDEADVYRVPRQQGSTVRNMWMAHSTAHVLLAREVHVRPSCDPMDTSATLEQEATQLARQLLVPTAALHGAHRELSGLEPHTADELANLVSGLAERFQAPAGWVAVRLAEERLLGVSA